MVTFGIPSQFLGHPNKARGVSRIHGSNEPHKCNGTHKRGHTDYRTLVFPTQSTRDGPAGQIPHRLQREACFCQPDQRCEKTQLPEFGSPAPNLGRNRNSKMGTGNKNLCAPSQTIRCSKVICRPRSTKRGCLYSKV